MIDAIDLAAPRWRAACHYPSARLSLHVWTALRWAFWTARPMRASANAKASASVALDTTLS